MRRWWLLVGGFTVGACDSVFDLERPPLPLEDAPTDTIVENGLIAWYPMDRVADLSVLDATGRARDGMCLQGGCPAEQSDGRVGNALQFDGLADRVAINGDEELLIASQFTVTLWARIDRIITDHSCMISKGFGTATGNSWQLCMRTGRPTVAWQSTPTLNMSEAFVDPDQVIVGVWRHYAVRWDGFTMSLSINAARVMAADAKIIFDASPVLLGADNDYGMDLGWLAGSLDDVRIYDRVLSDPELVQLFEFR